MIGLLYLKKYPSIVWNYNLVLMILFSVEPKV